MTEASPPDQPTDPDAIRADIEATREELSQTVDALAAKVDVKAQASAKAGAAKDKIAGAVSDAKAAAPEPVQHALDTVGAKTGPVAHQVSDTLAPYRTKILAGVGVALVALLVVRRRRKRD